MFSVEAPDEPRETALSGAHGLERNMRNVMPDATPRTARFFTREGGEVYVREDELHVRDFSVKAFALARKHARATPRLIPRKREESGEEPERNKDENEMHHGV